MKTICVAGKNDISVNVLEYLVTNVKDVEVIAITDRDDGGINGWQRSLRFYCERNGIKIVSLEEAYQIDDLCFFSTEFDRIVKPNLFKTEELFNIHFSLLPKYKGMFTSVLPILNGDSKTGVTLHKIRAGIDTGEIIDQKEITICKDWTSLDLYRELIRKGTEMVVSNMGRILNGYYECKQQTAEKSSYHPRGYLDYTKLQLETNRTAFQILNQVRAFAFRPYQLLKIYDIGIIGGRILEEISVEKPGTILYEDEVLWKMSTIDYDLILFKDVLFELNNAIARHDNVRAKSLLKYKPIVRDKEQHGWTPLTVAVYNNNIEMVDYLLSMGADENVVNNNGTTLLMYAKDAGIKTNDWSVFRFLLERGAAINQRDYFDKQIKEYLSGEEWEIIPKDITDLLRT